MLAFTFPGQGSQRPEMGAPWRDHPSWRLVEQATAITAELDGRDVGRLLLDADAEELRDTRNAQLTTFVTSMMVLDAVRDRGVGADYVAGHSLGEYTALAAAGVISFDDGVRLVTARAAAMHDAGVANPGTMAAVLGLAADEVAAACAEADGDAWLANDNSDGQIVIAGSEAGVAAAGEAAKQRGAKRVVALPVAGAFHTPYMAEARQRLETAIAAATLGDASVSVVANVDADVHHDSGDFAELMAAQLVSPVRWRETLARLADVGVTAFVEPGPGGVLTGMAKRAVRGATTLAIATPDDLEKLSELDTTA